MFEVFGEFDSVEELNNKAAELKEAESEDKLKLLAKENGIDEEDAEDYIDDIIDTLATPLSAAIGKLRVEAKFYQIGGVLDDWYTQIIEACTNDEAMRTAVRRKDKSLAGCIAKLIGFAFENKVHVNDKIVDAVTIIQGGKRVKMNKPLYLGIPNKTQVKQIISEYYLGE